MIGLHASQKVLLFGVERVGEDPLSRFLGLMNRESSYNDTLSRLPCGYAVVGMIHPSR